MTLFATHIVKVNINDDMGFCGREPEVISMILYGSFEGVLG